MFHVYNVHVHYILSGPGSKTACYVESISILEPLGWGEITLYFSSL